MLNALLNGLDLAAIVSFDSGQILSLAELKRDTVNKVKGNNQIVSFTLSKKIRTNREIAAFISGLFDLNKINRNFEYTNIEILYSSCREVTQCMIKQYNSMGYIYINHTPSSYYHGSFDSLPQTINSHHVIGLEFDNVLVVINNDFFYQDSRLNAIKHPNPNYIYTQLLYQEVTRVRERLCVIVEENLLLLREIMKIFPEKSKSN